MQARVWSRSRSTSDASQAIQLKESYGWTTRLSPNEVYQEVMVGDYDPFASHNHSVTTLPDKGREKEKRSQRERPNCDSALSTVELDDADGETETSASASACYWEPVEVDDAPAQGFPDFNEHRIPTAAEIWEACSAELIDEEGTWIRFRELFPPAPLDKDERKKPPPQTVVFFIRGLICGQCQDYMRTIAQLDTKAIADANVNVAIVTNGSWKGIRRYREILNCPFPMYTDPTLDVYAAWVSHNWVRTRRVFYRDLTPLIRMMPDPSRLNTLVSIFKGPNPRAAYHRRPAFAQAVVGLKNAARLGVMDIGSLSQMGGEFILVPGYRCTYAHRMPNKYSHESAAEVLKAAGVKTPVRINTDDVKEVDFQDKGIGGTTASYGHGHDFQTVSSSQIATFQTESLRTESFQTGSFRNFHTVPTSNFQTSPPRQASHSSTSSEAYNAQVAHWLNRELPPLPTEDPKHL